MNRDVSQARVAAVVAMSAHPVRRNYEITQAYADISRAFRDALGLEEANWCTFASWASATAGEFIRGEQIPQFLLGQLECDERFSARLAKVIAGHERARGSAEPRVTRLVELVALDVAREIAEGNLKVFRELAPAFIEVIELYRGGARPSPSDVEAHMERRLTAGPSTVDGQSRLLDAFGRYAEAAASSDPTRRSQLVLHGSALVGLHEQIRLQSSIEGGLMAPFERAVSEAAAMIARVGVFQPLRERMRVTLEQLAHVRFRGELDALRATYRDALTELFMSMTVPDGVVRLGADVKYPKGGLPEALGKVSIVSNDLKLALLLEGYGALTDGEEDSGARDWTRITDRMHFIIDFFRANQRKASLFDEPLSNEVREALSEEHALDRAI